MNHFWKTPHTTNNQITQILKSQFSQYMGTMRYSILASNPHKLKLHTMPQKRQKTPGHIYYLYAKKSFLKGLIISRHNAVFHQLTNLLKSCQHTWFLTLTNANTQNNTPQENTTPPWMLQCTCYTTKCQYLAKLCLDIISIKGQHLSTQVH